MSISDGSSYKDAIKLNIGSVDLPVMADNAYIKKTQILPQPESDPPLAIAAAVTNIEIYIVLEQVISSYLSCHDYHSKRHVGLINDQRPINNAGVRLLSE